MRGRPAALHTRCGRPSHTGPFGRVGKQALEGIPQPSDITGRNDEARQPRIDGFDCSRADITDDRRDPERLSLKGCNAE